MGADHKNAGISTEKLVDTARSSLSRAVSSLESCIERIATALEGAVVYDTKLGSHLAYMAEAAVTVTSGLRQLEAHEKKMAGDMSPAEQDAMVAEYIRDLPADRLGGIRVALAERDAERSVL